MRTWDVLDQKQRTMVVIKGYVEVNDDGENEIMKYMGEVWTERQRNERNRLKRINVSCHKRTIIYESVIKYSALEQYVCP